MSCPPCCEWRGGCRVDTGAVHSGVLLGVVGHLVTSGRSCRHSAAGEEVRESSAWWWLSSKASASSSSSGSCASKEQQQQQWQLC
jgi:hypothetical protein